ncbi:hypothetical protein EV702DRAFT_1202516 [Suillus placidus]|uniref:Uncharacterized protein n=1 Tax=Suillus placidus TaxID=48579 RepID=A0A9P6ZLG8_9AGAM|nr:hypothetical protein EV702DRAFT_1202516 [Suillus placidus]
MSYLIVQMSPSFCPSLTLKATLLHPCDNQNGALLDSIVDFELTRDTDAGYAQLFWTSIPSAILAMQQLSQTSREPASKATFKMIFKTLTLSLLSSAKPLHCIRRAIPIIHYLSVTSLKR